jgi:endonuclease I
LGSASDSDVHNLKPADPQQNSTRSNYPFVQGTGDAKLITNTSGGVIGFWPGTDDKGDIARILLYMHVRWGLNITASSVGELSLLLRWHLEDPVDDFERNRNDVIYTYQENRNPFIDYPDLAERIWGPIVLSDGSTANLSTTSNEYTMFPELNVIQDEIFNYKENQAYFIA